MQVTTSGGAVYIDHLHIRGNNELSVSADTPLNFGFDMQLLQVKDRGHYFDPPPNTTPTELIEQYDNHIQELLKKAATLFAPNTQ